MKRKRFIKKLQSYGVQRNVANWMADYLMVPVKDYGEFMCGFDAPGVMPDQALVNVAPKGDHFMVKVSKREARRIAEERLQHLGLDLSDVKISAEHRVGRGGGGND